MTNIGVFLFWILHLPIWQVVDYECSQNVTTNACFLAQADWFMLHTQPMSLQLYIEMAG